ncbi:helix-turn-helix domain-containing protein [Neobacillus notoginsengisoli]|uniref:Helix-turn-helix domain-containing protein n=1 Tax=Neobacillus notoginsengisoli TaxID=1578198 RepID=A0A417YQG9_9BACI|nr:RodZ domain-containing protein [Neobacillus notoginsengisoli]RHW36371.1 helix-turn-helix domain-containing protein [Neobacillus notoginsengisoli]
MTELGNRLKEARLEKGLSLDDLQAVTKIQKRYLSGIEEGNYSTMPGDFYVRAFIKQYSEAVGVDPDEIFDTYKAEIPSAYQQDLPEQLSRVKSRKGLPEGSSKILGVLPKVLTWVFVIGIAAFIYFLVQHFTGNNAASNKNQDKPPTTIVKPPGEEQKDDEKDNGNNSGTDGDENKKEEEPAEPETPAQELIVAESSGRNSTYDLKNAEKFEVKVVSTGETWVSIKNGKGKSFFQGMLAVGKKDSETVDFSNEAEAVIIVGRTVDTEIYVNGQKLDYAVPATERVRQDITIRYIKGNE